VLLQDPLTCEALAKLPNAEVDEVRRTLSNLHSLLAASERDGTFWRHHKTSADFITNQERCYLDPEFYINPALHHIRIAEGCLRMMDDNLTFNMCNLEAGEEYSTGMQSQGRARNTIPPQLAYACIHWASPSVELAGGAQHCRTCGYRIFQPLLGIGDYAPVINAIPNHSQNPNRYALEATLSSDKYFMMGAHSSCKISTFFRRRHWPSITWHAPIRGTTRRFSVRTENGLQGREQPRKPKETRIYPV